jgi:hypothetical protein
LFFRPTVGGWWLPKGNPRAFTTLTVISFGKFNQSHPSLLGLQPSPKTVNALPVFGGHSNGNCQSLSCGGMVSLSGKQMVGG